MLARVRRHLGSTANNRGFIIVAVLWILAALATLTSIMAVYVINSALAFAVHDERLQAGELTRAALELVAYRIKASQDMPLRRGGLVFRLGNASVTADFNSEAARIDLNSAPKALLAGLFVGLGADPNAANTYADRIVGYRSSPQDGTPDAEAATYRAAGSLYAPRGAPFQHAAELALVIGIPDFMVERAMPFVTVYSGLPQVNIADAAPQALAALPGMDPARLALILAQREQDAQNVQRLIAALGPAQPLATVSGSKAIRVTARVAFDSGQRMTSEVVIFILDSGAEPYRVLTWRDDIEDAPRGRTVLR